MHTILSKYVDNEGGGSARLQSPSAVSKVLSKKSEDGLAAASPRRGRTGTEQEVYDAIYEAVIDHRLPPGTKLAEVTLAGLFNVSRTLVRQALLRLAHENIVVLRPNRGAAVASPSIQEARDVFEARRVIEGAIMRSVVRSATKQDLNGLRALVRQEHEALQRSERSACIKLSGQFHVRLAEIGGNAVLASFLNELVSRTSLIIALYEVPGNAPCASHSHMDLIEAIARGNEEKAVTEMIEHLGEIEEKLRLVDRTKSVDLAEIFLGQPAKPGKKSRKS